MNTNVSFDFTSQNSQNPVFSPCKQFSHLMAVVICESFGSHRAFPGGSTVKNSPAKAGDVWQPTPVFLPGESQGQRSLVDLCGRTESDTTDAAQQQQQQQQKIEKCSVESVWLKYRGTSLKCSVTLAAVNWFRFPRFSPHISLKI